MVPPNTKPGAPDNREPPTWGGLGKPDDRERYALGPPLSRTLRAVTRRVALIVSSRWTVRAWWTSTWLVGNRAAALLGRTVRLDVSRREGFRRIVLPAVRWQYFSATREQHPVSADDFPRRGLAGDEPSSNVLRVVLEAVAGT